VAGWTLERRARQAEAISEWKPWEKSTGPKSPEGKAKVSRNAFKGGWRGLLRELSRALREQEEARRQLGECRRERHHRGTTRNPSPLRRWQM